jgi:hypothetical protein
MKRFLTLCLSLLFSIQPAWLPSYAQSYPDPKVELTSITNNDTYQDTRKVSFTVQFRRLNNYSYADQIRIWLCPEQNWNGATCSAGYIAISATPTSTATALVMSTLELDLAPGNYFVTSVTFKNGAVLNGYIVAYLRSGIVTIGGFQTTMPWVDITTADFNVPTPEPEPTAEPAPEPSTTEESNNQTTEPEQSDSSATQPTEPAPGTSEPTTSEEISTEPASDPASNQNTQDSSESEINLEVDAPVNSGDSITNSLEDSKPSNTQEQELSGEISEPATPQPNTENDEQQITSDEGLAPEETESVIDSVSDGNQIVTTQDNELHNQNESESAPSISNFSEEETEDRPELQVITPITQTPETTQSETAIMEINQTPIELEIAELPNQAISQMIEVPSITAKGGFLTKITGPAKLTTRLSAGVGRLNLLGNNKSGWLKVKIGSKEIATINLAEKSKFTIKWYAQLATTLKLIHTGNPDAEFYLDSIKINRQLIANPTFLMRN